MVENESVEETTEETVEENPVLTVFIEESDDSSGNPMFNEPLGDNEEKSVNEDELELGPGNINFLDKGQKANFAQPTHPNSGFSAFCETLICHIASGLGIPKEIVICDKTEMFSRLKV